MISGNDRQFEIRKATISDLSAIKQLADRHKEELGFVLRPALEKAVKEFEIFVADNGKEVVGFVHYHHRRDQQTTLYHIVVEESYRQQGIGVSLIQSLSNEAALLSQANILLKCPQELPANEFYSKCGFTLLSVDTGKRRPLNVWVTVPSQSD